MDYAALLLGGFLHIGLKYAGPFMIWSVFAYCGLSIAFGLIQKRKLEKEKRLLIAAAGVIGLVMTLLFPQIFLAFMVLGFWGMAMLFQAFRGDFLDMMIAISIICGIIVLLAWVSSRRTFVSDEE